MPMLTVVSERTPLKAYDFEAATLDIGRGDDMDIVIDNPSVSRRQARIRLEHDERWWSGSRLGQRHVPQRPAPRAPQPLARGDEIAFGKYSVLFDRALKDRRRPPTAASPSPIRPRRSRWTEGRRAAADGGRAQAPRAPQVGRRRPARHVLPRAPRAQRRARRALAALRPARARGTEAPLLVIRNRTRYEVRNLCAWSSMRVNGVVTAQAPLKSGDVIALRGLRMTFFDEIG